MKTILLTILFLTALSCALSLELLYYEDFSEYTMPAGWTTEGVGTWSVGESGYPLVEPPELFLTPMPGGTLFRCISQAIDTQGINECKLMFWHATRNNLSNTTPFTISLQVTANMVNWTTLWSWTGAADLPMEFVTVTIPHANLATTNFHYAFCFEGTYEQLIGWYIDSVYLGASQRIASGTWTLAASPYYLYCDYVVPISDYLIIEPGVQIIANNDCGIDVYGEITAEGTQADSIRFTSFNDMETWDGISIHQYMGEELRFSYCIFERCEKGESESGGALYIETEMEVSIFNCRFSENYAGNAGAVHIDGAWRTYIYNCLFEKNYSSGAASTLLWEGYESFDISFSAFRNNSFESGTNLGQAVFYAVQPYAHVDIYSNTFANSFGGLAACYFQGNQSQNYNFYINFNSCIFWNPNISYEAAFVEAFPTGHIPSFSYCDINPLKISGANPYFSGCLDADPMFKGYEDCHLYGSSPCINTGQFGAMDPDGSRKDMGAYPIYNKAVIQTVNDVPYDQGRKVEVFWKRSEMDNTWMPGAFYSVWRGDTFRGTGTVITSPLDLNRLTDLNNVWWVDERNTAWQLVSGQINAYNFPYYAFEAPTQQDSSATGNNSVPFKIVYQWANGFSTSAEMSGYSVDNIPPDAVRNLVISKQSSALRLDWIAVTSGTYNGTSFPELNGIRYKIYCSDDPYFEVGPATYLTTTTNTFQLYEYLTANKKFFKVVTSDQ